MNKMQAMLQRTIAFMPDWMGGLALVALALVLALVLHRIAATLVKRAIGQRRSLAVQILEATSGPTKLALCLAAVAFVMPAAARGACDGRLRGRGAPGALMPHRFHTDRGTDR